jgi:hypothetical protein
MKKELLQQLILIAVGSVWITGCASQHPAWVREPSTVVYPFGELLVTELAPPPRHEVAGTPPDEAHVWVEGYWMASDEKWIRIPGHYEFRGPSAPAQVGQPRPR